MGDDRVVHPDVYPGTVFDRAAGSRAAATTTGGSLAAANARDQRDAKAAGDAAQRGYLRLNRSGFATPDFKLHRATIIDI